MTVNIPLLDTAIAWAERSETQRREPGEPIWDQSTWHTPLPGCGTACCIAGYIALADGQEPDLNYVVKGLAGDEITVREYAQFKLGIGSLDAAYLFSGSNSLDDLKRMRDNLANGRIIWEGVIGVDDDDDDDDDDDA